MPFQRVANGAGYRFRIVVGSLGFVQSHTFHQDQARIRHLFAQGPCLGIGIRVIERLRRRKAVEFHHDGQFLYLAFQKIRCRIADQNAAVMRLDRCARELFERLEPLRVVYGEMSDEIALWHGSFPCWSDGSLVAQATPGLDANPCFLSLMTTGHMPVKDA